MIAGAAHLADRPRRRAIRCLLASLLCLLPLTAQATPANDAPLLVLSGFSPSYNQVRDAIVRTAQVKPDIITLDQLASRHRQAGLVVAVGSRACEQLLSQYDPQTQLICTFLPSTTFTLLQQTLLPNSSRARISAIFIDQPLQRQIHLARLISPQGQVLGSALGSSSRALQQALQTGSQAARFELLTAHLTPQDNPIEKLTPVISASDVFLVIPDSSVFNRAISKWLLYLSLRNQLPVIGFSEHYTQAGATASVHSSATQIGRQTGEWLNRLQSGAGLPPPSHPAYFNVSTNPVAARTLKLDLPTPAELERQLRTEATDR
ncbi:ABC transporter substrate-binding protein [Marinobacterium weihaiense]|uniref:ABC transporter substrate binding protein n=1 Tax=Marinobacterium weihaiense TaxID=2851016 RepID=A0ABS6MDS3_9GAMM|nr:hypothetical protein [Marinobacterium weihaiense]MBV0934462.1 hypothetical protein [Marinobacterium weihaiense]